MYSKVAWVLASPDRIFVECRMQKIFPEKRLRYGEFPSNFKYSRNTRKKHFHFQYSYKWYIGQLELLKRNSSKSVLLRIFCNF